MSNYNNYIDSDCSATCKLLFEMIEKLPGTYILEIRNFGKRNFVEIIRQIHGYDTRSDEYTMDCNVKYSVNYSGM